jgi:tetratricopeptide (TPR) repeat protein
MSSSDAATRANALSLLRQGRHEAAEQLLEQILAAAPNDFDARLLLAQAQASRGEFTGAEANYRAALRLRPRDAGAISGLGAVLNDLARFAEGEEILRLPADGENSPWPARIAHNLGVALERQHRFAEALPHFDAALGGLPDHPLTLHSRAKTLEHLGRTSEAVDDYRRALAVNPFNLEAHRELNALLYRLGRDDEFLTSYENALRRVGARAPEHITLLLHKAGFLMRTERFEEARESFAHAAALAPEAAAPLIGLAAAQAGLGEIAQAIAIYEKVLARHPDDAGANLNLASAFLEAGESRRALQLTQTLLLRLPLDQSVLAMHEAALRANNDPRAERLADYERHVRIFDLEPPDGFASMPDFNAALNNHLDSLHTDRRENFDQTLRRGTQTSEPLFASDNALLRALRVRIEQAVAAYIRSFDAEDDDHPLAARRKKGFDFSGSWSSRLHDCGFHTNHIHPSGWISSCYYVELPDAVADEDGKQGWIKFGEPSFKTVLQEPIRRAIKPVPGRLVLFPSYMWHGTIAFRSASARTTIAFDAVPA